MSTYSDYAQRDLDIASGGELDRRAAKAEDKFRQKMGDPSGGQWLRYVTGVKRELELLQRGYLDKPRDTALPIARRGAYRIR